MNGAPVGIGYGQVVGIDLDGAVEVGEGASQVVRVALVDASGAAAEIDNGPVQ